MSGVRSLAALSSTASTSRVLNLNLISHRLDLEPCEEPRVSFFEDGILNRVILIKHRLRPEERHLFSSDIAVATKLVFPIDRLDLRAGGRSILINQIGYLGAVCHLLGKDHESLSGDLSILQLLDELPSLDPFLVREQLSRSGHKPHEDYFGISPADAARMQDFTCNEISGLISLAFAGDGPCFNRDLVKRLATALLSTNADARLDPLRQTLGLQGHQFTQGIFSWKGFLYYKWQFSSVFADLAKVSWQMDSVRTSSRADSDTRERIVKLKKSIRVRVRDTAESCRAVLGLYDAAFRGLIERRDTAAFRTFLLDAPTLFVDLGHAMGTISHIASYWNYRFAPGQKHTPDSAEFVDILQEFDNSLAPRKPVRSMPSFASTLAAPEHAA